MTCILVWCMLVAGHPTKCERPLKVDYFEEPFRDTCQFKFYQMKERLAAEGRARAVSWDHTIYKE